MKEYTEKDNIIILDKHSGIIINNKHIQILKDSGIGTKLWKRIEYLKKEYNYTYEIVDKLIKPVKIKNKTKNKRINKFKLTNLIDIKINK